MDKGKNLEDMIPEMEFKIIRELAVMAEQDPEEKVRKVARNSLYRRYEGNIIGTATFGDSIYVDIMRDNVHNLYYVCEKVDYELKIADTSSLFD